MDTTGFLLSVVVHAADIQERESARWLLAILPCGWRTIERIWADQGYTGDLKDWLATEYGIELIVVARTQPGGGFERLPRRWVVERTFAWLGRSRRLSKDYEQRPENSEAVVYLAAIACFLKRLKPDSSVERPYKRKVA